MLLFILVETQKKFSHKNNNMNTDSNIYSTNLFLIQFIVKSIHNIIVMILL